MDQKKVADLAKSFSLSCKKLVKDTKLMRTLTAPSVVLISLTVVHLVSIVPSKSPWEWFM